MIKKEFSRTIPQAKVARLIKKVFPNVIIKLKGSIYGIVWGVQINSECYPVSGWLQKTISWYAQGYYFDCSSFKCLRIEIRLRLSGPMLAVTGSVCTMS